MDRAKFSFNECLKSGRFTTYNHTQDIQQLNYLLGKYGLKVNNHIDSPTLTTYIINLNVDTKINSVLKLEKNFQIAVNDNNVRIYLDGNKLCIEKKGADNTVRMGNLIPNDFVGKKKLLMAIGIDNKGRKTFYDLNKAPHMLIAGTTGSGKSVLTHQIICSLLMNHHKDVNIIGIDPKGNELNKYACLKNFKFIADTQAAINELKRLCDEMEVRYSILSKSNCRDIDTYIEKGGNLKHMVCIIDEFADLILSNRGVEDYVVRLAQKARAAGIHLIIATQRPTADVITGLIKANIPTRIALKVTSSLESRIILDHKGAEKLNGKGDMLFLANGKFEPERCQAAFIDDQEITSIVCKAWLENGGDVHHFTSAGRPMEVNY